MSRHRLRTCCECKANQRSLFLQQWWVTGVRRDERFEELLHRVAAHAGVLQLVDELLIGHGTATVAKLAERQSTDQACQSKGNAEVHIAMSSVPSGTLRAIQEGTPCPASMQE